MSTGSAVVLILNAGSSSLKFAAYASDRDLDGDGDPDLLLSGNVEELGRGATFSAKDAAGGRVAGPALAGSATHDEAIAALLPWLSKALGGARLVGAGHRIVHGGVRFAQPERITPAVVDALVDLSPLAPLHQPANIAGIRAVLQAAPGLPQVACFDTAFHRTQSELTQLFALPLSYFKQGVRRYGFHGLSYEWIASRLPGLDSRLAEGRCVVLHLGNGASMCAMEQGRSVASTMGFTALDGLPMGTRSGSLDPGVLLHLMNRGHDAAELEALLYQRSGLLGISGISSDMRVLLGSPEPSAKLAVDYFVHRILRELGSLACAMGGLDGIVFTAGIGENAGPIREAVLRGAAWLGFELDPVSNQERASRITLESSPKPAYVVPTDENRIIARHTTRLLANPAS